MLDLLLNAVRLATSKDVRDSTSGLLELIRRSPDWQQDICEIAAKVGPSYREQAILLGGLTIEKMAALSFPAEATKAFEAIYFELISNAFEHGCRNKKDLIKICIQVSRQYIALIVSNPKGRRFNFHRVMHDSAARLGKNRFLRRGRGLRLVSELADDLASVNRDEGVKALVYKERVSIDVIELERLTVLRIQKGIYNPSFNRRLLAAAKKFSQTDLILDFTLWEPGSTVSLVTLDIHEWFAASSDRKVAALLSSYSVNLPESIVAWSWKQAFEKVGRPDLSEAEVMGRS